jgi:hypothetical protein
METYTRQTAQAVAVQDDPEARELLHRAFDRTSRWRADFAGLRLHSWSMTTAWNIGARCR